MRIIRETPGYRERIDRSLDRRITQSLRRLIKAWNIVAAVFKEIFDETAYERFLARTRLTRSTESYGKFLRERQNALAHQPRCC